MAKSSFTKQLFSSSFAQLIPDKTLRSSTNFLPEHLNLEGQSEFAISEKSYPSMYQNVTQEKFTFFDQNISKSSELDHLEPGLYPFITNIVQSMNTLIPERHNYGKSCIIVKVSRNTQKVQIYVANERSGSGLGSLVGTRDFFLEVMKAIILG